MSFSSVELKTHSSVTNSMNPSEEQIGSVITVIDYWSVYKQTGGALITLLISVDEYWSYLLRGGRWRGGRRWWRMEPCLCVHRTKWQRRAESGCKKRSGGHVTHVSDVITCYQADNISRVDDTTCYCTNSIHVYKYYCWGHHGTVLIQW